MRCTSHHPFVFKLILNLWMENKVSSLEFIDASCYHIWLSVLDDGDSMQRHHISRVHNCIWFISYLDCHFFAAQSPRLTWQGDLSPLLSRSFPLHLFFLVHLINPNTMQFHWYIYSIVNFIFTSCDIHTYFIRCFQFFGVLMHVIRFELIPAIFSY